MKLVFFGSSHYVIPVVSVLKNNFDLSLVVTTEKNPNDAVPSYCIKNKIELLLVSNLSDPSITYKLSTINSPLGVLASFGGVIPKEILDLFPNGILNIHPSLLPKYRGPTPVQTAILNGDKTTGVTIIKLDEKIDHGPILAQEEEEILPDDTTLSLQKRSFEKGAKMLSSIIRIIESKQAVNEIAQDEKKAIYTKALTRNSGFIDLNNPPSKEVLEKMVKAFYPWPGVWFKAKLGTENLEPKTIKLLPASSSGGQGGPDQKIQVEGKNPMTYKDFINGYREGKEIITKLELV